MRNYDLTLILSPFLSEEEANDLFQQLVSFVQEQGGILEDQRLLGKKPLLAPIQGSKEGYLALITFSLSEEKLPDLEKKCKETQHILRFFMMRQTKRAKRARIVPTTPAKLAPVLDQRKPARPTPATTPDTSTGAGGKEKVTLADIDEKLEEIFRE